MSKLFGRKTLITKCFALIKAGYKKTVAAICLLIMLPCFVTPSSAMTSPPTEFFGCDASGVPIKGNNRVIIENQTITYDLPEFPAVTEEEIATTHSGSVKTEYTLYNPTDSEITLKIAYHLPKTPYCAYNGHGGMAEPEKYSVLINDDPAEVTLRHALNFYSKNAYEDFSSLISDEYVSNGFCSPDMTVTKYTFRQSGVTRDYAHVGFDYRKEDLQGSCLFFGEQAYVFNQEDGDMRLHRRVGENGCTYELYVFGKDLMHLPNWKFYQDSSASDRAEATGKMEYVSKETMTLSDFASEHYDQSRGFSELDWFNMLATEISYPPEGVHTFTTLESIYGDISSYLASGYVYEITLAPRERVVHTLIAPVYPTVETGYEPHTFSYTYLLSPTNAPLLSDKIKININTPFYMINSPGINFDYEKTEYGYSLTLDAIKVLYEDEYNEITDITKYFFFTLCESENPEKVEKNIGTGIVILLILLAIVILPVLLVRSLIDGVANTVRWLKGLVTK